MYADDSQVYITVNPEDSHTTINNLEQHLRDVQAFFADNMLSCNPKKTEIVHFHSRFSHPLSYSSIKLSQHYVPISKKARNLGVIFDSHLTMSSHVNSSCSSASLGLRNIGRIRKYLDQRSTERPVHASLFKQTFCQLPVTDHRTSLILFYFDFSLSLFFIIIKIISDKHR